MAVPGACGKRLISRFDWEVLFHIQNAEIAAKRREQTHVAGCAYRALACIAQVLFAVDRRYLINEKGALTEADTFPQTIVRATQTVSQIWDLIGRRDFDSALRLLGKMSTELDRVVGQAR
jgi:hypothetical protein